MQPLSIVKHFQILKDRAPSLLPGLIGLTIHTFGLQGAIETLHQGVVVAIGFVAHAHHNAKVGQKGAIVLRGILTATIRVMQESRLRMTTRKGHASGLFYQRLLTMTLHGPPDD